MAEYGQSINRTRVAARPRTMGVALTKLRDIADDPGISVTAASNTHSGKGRVWDVLGGPFQAQQQWRGGVVGPVLPDLANSLDSAIAHPIRNAPMRRCMAC